MEIFILKFKILLILNLSMKQGSLFVLFCIDEIH